MATLNGLDRLDPRSGTIRALQHDPSDPASLSNNRVNTVLVDRRGRLWVGTQGGLNRRDAGSTTFEAYRTGDVGLSDDFIRVLLEDRAGTIWLGTEVGGVCRWREADGRFDCFRSGKDASTLSDDRVFSLYESESGPIWIGTDNGLNQLDPKTARITRIGGDAGVPTDDIYGLLGDRLGALWISSGRGLYWFDPRTGRSRMFTEAEGLRGIAFSRGACAAAQDGSLFFGALTGVIRAWPDRVHASADPPLIAVTDVLVDETRITAPLGTMTELNLPWRITSFRIAFAALDYRHSEANQYLYRLEGFEPKWRSAGPDAAAVYTNLDAGDYTLRIRAANGEGVWTEQGIGLPIHIRPPWWETLAFRLSLFLLITTITATIVVARVAMLKRGQRELGRLVDERTGQLVEANRALEQLARTDGLTGLSNYRAFTETLEGEWLRSRREARPLSVTMVDVDRFKAYNDTFGHRAGDEALRRVAGAIGALGKRVGDVVARYGGDEFAMVLVGSDRQGRLDAAAGGARSRAPRRPAGAAGGLVRELPLRRLRDPDRPGAAAAGAAHRRRGQRGRRGREDGAALDPRAGRGARAAGGGDLCRALGPPGVQRPVRRPALVLRIALIACGALAQPAADIVERRGWSVAVHPLPPLLHNQPHLIADEVRGLATELALRHETVAVAYADCGTYGALDAVCSDLGLRRLPGLHCYDLFAGESRLAAFLDEQPGTYLLTDFLVRSFDRTVVRELGLDRHPELRDDYFRHYTRVVWLAQEPSEELRALAEQAAQKIGLPLTVVDTGDGRLEAALEELLTPAAG